jgi:hypothetical protein
MMLTVMPKLISFIQNIGSHLICNVGRTLTKYGVTFINKCFNGISANHCDVVENIKLIKL